MAKIDMRDAFFERLTEVARIDERIVVLSADHGAFALEKFQEEMPDRYINMGIAEQNMVGVAAGLAASGKIVFIYGITPFVSLRVLEQLTLDVAAMQLPVNVISVGAGFTYSTDGPTHQGLQDVAAVSTIPEMIILNSSDPINTRAFVDFAVKNEKPIYIRIEKEMLENFERKESLRKAMISGYSNIRNKNSRILIISTGLLSHTSLEVAKYFEENLKINLDIIDLHRIRPINESLCQELVKYDFLFVLEEAYRSTIASDLLKMINDKGIKIKLYSLDAGNKFHFNAANRNKILKKVRLDRDDIVNIMNDSMKM
jgi:transketolase